MDFRKQIEEYKRDLKLEKKEKERIENEKFAYRVKVTAEDIRKRLLGVATKIEKSSTLNYCGLLAGFNFNYCNFYECIEEDVSTFWTAKSRLTYKLTPTFNTFFTVLNIELKKDDISLGKPFFLEGGINWADEDTVAIECSHETVIQNVVYVTNYILDCYADKTGKPYHTPWPSYKSIMSSTHYDFPHSKVVLKKEANRYSNRHVEIIIPFYYKF